MAVLLLLGTIDRIEGSWAVVEWLPSAELADVALAACPAGIAEGDRIQLIARARPDGSAVISRREGRYRLITHEGPIGLPEDAPLPADQRFVVSITKQAIGQDLRGRTHPIMGTREHGSMDLRLFRVGAPVLSISPGRGRSPPAGPAEDRPEAALTPQPPDPPPPPDPGRAPPPDRGTESSHSGQ
jgi:hypothetical protein